ncbi:hypothetical protein GLOIN_2v1779024 [Rhizophagus irregularis DAOM 181602=DAOM 197198]|uniref:Uncharacterized protein n=1 Tax=Rhizophagus irregularis (strain DAOM 181602 / DAOM 197198 / MUCL 43194) TaxID=747089 RepID=A0A2P4PQU0_RHIID|nr:hypothetical protein GLOIN_2v1779024 [Rhizophagus irregularis DAOM 181602=DAOM 197198]POG67759.1 hypothetical protein GLOIN_2v1779024 [Rhizophagus irregularis DAOM 181602=DAOM 197198]|eukprot:XP_025174625.1 hypothetical protein GLOIN_2v1779024 [Rhizophagus irregularis DAOM 181602=DAOM 197198]
MKIWIPKRLEAKAGIPRIDLRKKRVRSEEDDLLENDIDKIKNIKNSKTQYNLGIGTG